MSCLIHLASNMMLFLKYELDICYMHRNKYCRVQSLVSRNLSLVWQRIHTKTSVVQQQTKLLSTIFSLSTFYNLCSTNTYICPNNTFELGENREVI